MFISMAAVVVHSTDLGLRSFEIKVRYMIPFVNSEIVSLSESLKLKMMIFGLSVNCSETSSSKDKKEKAGSLFELCGSNR